MFLASMSASTSFEYMSITRTYVHDAYFKKNGARAERVKIRVEVYNNNWYAIIIFYKLVERRPFSHTLFGIDREPEE